MADNRKKILEMLSKGKIDIDEALKLLDLVEQPETSDRGEAESGEGKKKPKYLRVVVEPSDSQAGPDADRVNIRVPMTLLYAGVKLTTLIPHHAVNHVNRALSDKGIDMDLRNLKPEDLEPLIDALGDMEVEVQSGKENVHIFVE